MTVESSLYDWVEKLKQASDVEILQFLQESTNRIPELEEELRTITRKQIFAVKIAEQRGLLK